MFEWRFRVTPGIIPRPFLESAYFAGWGRVPRLTQTTVQESTLTILTDSTSSGTVHIPMVHSPLGVLMESTESLLSRQEPYLLLKELARGSLGRFYRRLFDWQMLGFQQSEELAARVNRLAKRFANLIVERDSQKPIILGRGAARLKQIGTEARHRISRLVGTPVHLDLKVKVVKDWQRNPKSLNRLGF